jgi:hypothetical protein
MMTLAEVNMRVAHNEWLEAKRQWALALQAINIAKSEWEQAQAEFYGDRQAMTSAANCGSCTGCST